MNQSSKQAIKSINQSKTIESIKQASKQFWARVAQGLTRLANDSMAAGFKPQIGQ
jgi:hypothetical protein